MNNLNLSGNDIIANGASLCVMDYDLAAFKANRVDPLEVRIAALEHATGPGQNGRELELKRGVFPEGATEAPDTLAILWRLVARPNDPQEAWKLLVFQSEITGPRGDRGPDGNDGKDGSPGAGVNVAGTVYQSNDLYKLTGLAVNSFYLVTSTRELWIFKGPAGHEHDHNVWTNMGSTAGVKGDKGDKGQRGPKGDTGATGSAGSISSFLLQWIVDSATSSAISSVMIEVNTAINDAITMMANQLATLAENAATAAVEKAIDEMMDQFKGDKGEKGDKGDKGDDGKDGKSVRMVGRYDTLTQFTTRYPAIAANVGVAALIGPVSDKTKPAEVWAITETPAIGNLPPHYTYENLGDIQGPKGDKGVDAEWQVSIRDKDFVEKLSIEVVSGLPAGVAGMYVQETDSILIEPLAGSPIDPSQVGYRMRMKYPIPTLIPKGSVIGTPTVDKFLTNDGKKLEWADVGIFNEPKDKLLLTAPNGSIYALTVDNSGRLNINIEPATP